MKKTSDVGFAVITTCYKDGEYSPSEYASSSQMTAIAAYLKSKNL
jgi:hypothetical protein